MIMAENAFLFSLTFLIVWEVSKDGDALEVDGYPFRIKFTMVSKN